jgi:tetratricopeptide (TPR) repeat protein
VGGLTPQEATQYAGGLLAAYPAAGPRRANRAFGELMQWLDGHPLSMRLVLPHLDSSDPKALLAGLQGTAPLPGWDDGQGGRLTSLPASLGYSYAHLDPVHQRLLEAVGLFHDTANAGLLTVFSGVDGVPKRFRGVSGETWIEALDAAAGVGLLTRLWRGMYRILPALPAYLAARWRTEAAGGYDGQRAGAIRALLSVYAGFGGWLMQEIGSSEAGLAYTMIGLQQRTMGHLLGYALDKQLWGKAAPIAQPLIKYWDSRGLYAEAAAWADRVFLATEGTNGVPPEPDSAAGPLRLLFVAAQARRQAVGGRPDAAERSLGEIRAMLQAEPTSPLQQANLGMISNYLGTVAQDRGLLDNAADLYARALAISQELGDRPGLAAGYHQLGMVAQAQGRLDEAAGVFAQSLAISEELGDRPGLAAGYHQIGTTAYLRGRLDEAAEWYARA